MLEKRKLGITAVIRSLGGGGAERILSSMLNHWAGRGFPVTVVTTTEAKNHAYPLHPGVRSVTIPSIPYTECLDDCPWDVKELRKVISAEGHGTVLSFMEKSNIPTILAMSGLPAKLIVCERTDPRTQKQYSQYKKDLVRHLYPYADALIVQTKAVEQDWAVDFMPHEKTHVIQNFVITDTRENVSRYDWLPQKYICCMGRLTPSKGFYELLDAINRIEADYPEYSWVILGEGPDRYKLEKRISDLNLNGKVFLPGFIAKPHSILQKADLFVFSSHFEGFPNALIEAMAVGLAPVSFACPSGPEEIIDDGINGFLVPPKDYLILQERILTLINNPSLRCEMALEAQRKIRKTCNPASIMAKWDALINELQYATPSLREKGSMDLKQFPELVKYV